MYSQEFINASKYAISNLTELEIAEVMEAWGMRYPMPHGIQDKISDLMEEYGEDNGLAEGWWLNEGDTEEAYLIGTGPEQETTESNINRQQLTINF